MQPEDIQLIEKILLIDDKREYPKTTAIARTYDSGIFLLQLYKWDMLLLDHDLGCLKDGREYSGYDILCWLEWHPEHLPGRIELVTMNPAVMKKMQQVINKLYFEMT
jgi:hypothetical protein